MLLRIRSYIGLVALIFMSACSPYSPYAPGKSASSIPAHIEVVKLKQVALAHGADANKDPLPDPNPSPNDIEVGQLVKRNIISQLTNFGYTLTEDPNVPADVDLRFYIYYTPERWPLIGRNLTVVAIINDTDGKTLFKINEFYQNSTGLIGAMVGPSRDEMVSTTSREVVVKLVNELRKGTKNNIPVARPVAIRPEPAPEPAPATISAPIPATSEPPTRTTPLVFTPPQPLINATVK